MHIQTRNQKNWEKSFYGGEGLVKGRAAIGFGLERKHSALHVIKIQ